MKTKILWTNNPKEDALPEVRPWPSCGKRAKKKDGRAEEIDLRKAQLELEQKKHNEFLQVLQQQQQQQMQAFKMLFQQQQQAELFLKLFQKLEKKVFFLSF